ncbi:MAG: TonB family protein [candidate division WOR-3 bacterium]
MKVLKNIMIFFTGILFLLCVRIERRPVPGSEKGGILRVGMVKEPQNLNPIFPPLLEPNPFYDLIFQPLFRIEKGKVIPCLAESWEFSEDLKSITFYLRKNVKWHDGEEFTSEDVIFTYNLIIDPEINSPLRSQFRFITRATPLGKYAVKFDFSKIYLYELFDCNFYPLPSHLLKDKKEISKFSENPVGIGPYKLKRWIKGNLIELEANESYFLFIPPIKTIYFKFYPSPEIVSLAYEQGRVDIALDLTPREINYLKEKNKNFKTSPGNRVFFIGFNLQKFPYNDINFRKAINLLINKSEIISKVMEGYAEITFSPIPSNHWAYDSTLSDAKVDLSGAKRILESIGFKNTDRDPYLELLGKDFTLEIITEDEPEKIKIAESIKKYVEDAGIACEVNALSGLDFVKRLRERNFSIYLFSWTCEEKIDFTPLWHSQYGIFNFTGFKNEELDKAIENSILTINQIESKRNFRLAQRILNENLPAIFLFTNKNLIAYSERVKGLDAYLDFPIQNLDVVYIPKEIQEVRVEFEIEETKEVKKEEAPLPPPPPKEAVPPVRAEEILRAELVKKETPPPPPPEVKEETPPPAPEVKEEVPPPKPEEPRIVAEAKILKGVQPEYPEIAKKLGLKGMVIVRVLVDKNGKVIDARILKSSNYPILDEAALNASKEFIFEPVKDEEGKPVEFFTTIPFRF